MRPHPGVLVLISVCLLLVGVSDASSQIIYDEFLLALKSRALGIEPSGSYPLSVCGETQNGMGVWQPAVWRNDGVGGWVLEMLPGLAPGRRGAAYGVLSPCGPLTGDALACGYGYDGLDRLRPVAWYRSGGMWTVMPLPTIGGNRGEALGLACDADFEYFVGFAEHVPVPPAPDSPLSANQAGFNTAVVWSGDLADTMFVKLLPDYGPDRESAGNDIEYDETSDRLYVAGYAENVAGARMAQVWYSANAGALWTRVELPAPPGASSTFGSDAGYGNNRVYVVGTARVAGANHAVVWESMDMGLTWMFMDYGVPMGYESAVGLAGAVGGNAYLWTGAAVDVQGTPEAAYWYDDMNQVMSGPVRDLLDMPSPIHLSEIRGMDGYRRMVGWGVVEVPPAVGAAAYAVADTDTVAVVLTPIAGTGISDALRPSLQAQLEARPNPFNPSVAISFSVRTAGRTRVAVYDASGRQVTTLFDGTLRANERHNLVWDARDRRGNTVASGVYFVRLTGPRASYTRKVVLVQ